MASIHESGKLVQTWLVGEQPHQFEKFDTAYGAEIAKRSTFIGEDEIPQKWHLNLLFRRQQALHRANQQVLKVCAASRAVVVYEACLLGMPRAMANDASFRSLRLHIAELEEAVLPPAALLNEPYEVAFPDQEPLARFHQAAELAIRAVQATELAIGKGLLPTPGLPSGPVDTFICY